MPGTAHASNLLFGSSINLSNNTIVSGYPVTAAVGSRVYVAWLNNSVQGNIQNVLFRASSNNGTTFGPIVKVSKAPTQDSASVQIAAAGNYVYLAWQQNSTAGYHIFFSSSSDSGTTFGTPIDVSGNVSGLAQSEFPELAAADKNVYVGWRGTTSHNPTTNIYVKVSKTNGSDLATVTATRLTTSANACIGSCLDVGAITNHVYVAWSDLGSTSAQTYFSSATNTTSFSPAVSINNHPSGQSDIDQAMAVSGNNVYVTWTNDTSSCTVSCDNTMFRASVNNGGTWGSVMNLYPAQVTDRNPQVAAAGSNVYVVWSNSTSVGDQVLYRASNNNGLSFNSIIKMSNPLFSSGGETVVALGTNVYVGWVQGTEVYFASSSDNGLTFGTSQDLSPGSNAPLNAIAMSSSGSNVFVAWEDDSQGNGDILFRATVPGAPDVAVSYIGLSKTIAYSGINANPIIVNVTAANPGPVVASFVVSVKANGTFIAANQTVTNLSPGGSVLLQFSWNTASLAKGSYTLTCYASQVTPTGETNLSNNVKSWGSVFKVRLKGDVSGDCKVDIVDLATVGSTFGKVMGDPGWNAAADLNNDKVINIVDMVNVAGNFGAIC